MRFRIINTDYMYDYREACLITQGKDMWNNPEEQGKCIKRFPVQFWIKQMCANHSTLRSVHFRLVDTRPKSVVMQVIRATKGHPQPEVQASRPDWTGKERSYDPYEDKLFMQDHTAESFIEMAKQRLCIRTEARTRAFMEEMVQTLKHCDEPFLVALGYCCKPACEWAGGRCVEINSCRKYDKLSDSIIKEYELDKLADDGYTL